MFSQVSCHSVWGGVGWGGGRSSQVGRGPALLLPSPNQVGDPPSPSHLEGPGMKDQFQRRSHPSQGRTGLA